VRKSLLRLLWLLLWLWLWLGRLGLTLLRRWGKERTHSRYFWIHVSIHVCVKSRAKHNRLVVSLYTLFLRRASIFMQTASNDRIDIDRQKECQ
jgi:hypothetical protein